MEKLSIQDGLFSNRIYKTYRDNAGYLWIAGINGLAKYDGLHVVNYTEHSDSFTQFIQGSRFYDVLQDKQSNIWVAANTGLHKYDAANNTFHQIAQKQITNASFLRIINDSILGISCANKSNFYLNCHNNSVSKTTEISNITSVILDNSGTVWKSTSDGCVIYDDRDTILNVKTNINDICFTPNGDLYLATSSGLVIVSQSEMGKDKKLLLYITETSPKFSITNNSVTSVEYVNACVWVGTRKGLNQIKLNDNGQPFEVLHYYNQPTNPYSLCNNQVNDIYTDNEGIIWISTHGGLNKIDSQHLWFYSFRNNPEDPNSLHDNIIFPINGDSLGNIWFGSFESGASRFSTKKGQFTRFNSAAGNTIKHVYFIYTDKQNTTWIAADNKLLCAGESELESVKIVNSKGANYSFGKISTIIQHSNGNYWMGIDKDLVELKKVSDKLFQVVQITKLKSSVICIFEDNYQRIWACTTADGILLNPSGKDETFISYNTQNHPALKTNEIQEISHDSEGNLWFGSVNGLYRVANDSTFLYSPEDISFTGFYKEDGLTDNYVTGILPGENGVLWLSSWKGIMKYDPKCIKMCRFTPFSFSDGLVDEKYNRNGAYLDQKTNTYYFGSPSGVNYFNPLKEVKTKVLPLVLVNQIRMNGKPVTLNFNQPEDSGKPEIIADIKRKGRINQLIVQFGSSSLLSPQKQVFAWKLEGKDERWTFSRSRKLLLQDIGPGEYTLKIRAASREGQLGAPVLISVRVESYFVSSLKFMFLILLIAGAGFWLYKRQRIKTELKRKENKYVFSKLTDDKSARAANRLSEIMTNDKPFLQSDLTAEKLAKLVDVSQGELSQILNEYLQTRFYEYVNKHRVEEFIRLLQTSDAEKLTINALSEKCGFSSKSTFYRAFNNEKGMTPAQFAKTLKMEK